MCTHALNQEPHACEPLKRASGHGGRASPRRCAASPSMYSSRNSSPPSVELWVSCTRRAHQRRAAARPPKPAERPTTPPESLRSAGALTLPASARPPAPARRRSSRLRRSALLDGRPSPTPPNAPGPTELGRDCGVITSGGGGVGPRWEDTALS